METLTPAFICWYAQHPSSTHIGDVLASLTLFFRFYPKVGENCSITALEPAEVTAKLLSLITHTQFEGVKATHSLMRFLDFLHDSGRWSGSQGSFQALHDILEDILYSEVSVRIGYRHPPGHVPSGSADWP